MPPGWDGIETIKHIWALDKDIQIVICTAYSDYSWEETVAHLGKTDNLLILKKPFDTISVRQLACALVTKWQLTAASRHYTTMLKEQIADKTLSLQQSLSLVKSTFESSSDGILVVNKTGGVIDFNRKLADLLDIPNYILETRNENKIFDYLNDQLISPPNFFEKLKNINSIPDEIYIDVLAFGNGKVFECYSQPHKLNNEIIGRILDFRDITKRAKLEQELQFQATHDSLTGLENRVKLLERLRVAIKISEQTKTKFAVLFVDFDRFKLVNDSLSHAVGDELLQAAAKRLQSLIRSEDALARLGGDEFVIVLMNVTNSIDIRNKVEEIIAEFQKPFKLTERDVTLTASIGVSLYPEDGGTVDILLRNADAAMYAAKAVKGNNYRFYSSELNAQSLEELDCENELRQAIANHEFFLCYQPQLDLREEKLVAVEALLRWQHPRKGVLLPMDFIPLAEETGLIVPICEWTLYTACEQNKKWQELGFPPIRVAVNITAQQFKQKNLVEMVKTVLQKTGLAPNYLELELTENVLISNMDVIRTVTELKELGVHIAVDDFGTGYSSLSYLHKIPLDRLKIDSSFIKSIHSASDDAVVIRAIISMAHNLNLEVLAEGVETIDQLNFLKKYECGDVQGFYFSTPLTVSELENYLKNPANLKKIKSKISSK